MDGPMAGVVPDVVEQEIGNFSRTLYKLEKGFAEVPAPRRLASKVISSTYCSVPNSNQTYCAEASICHEHWGGAQTPFHFPSLSPPSPFPLPLPPFEFGAF